jgi:uncharacterized protein DUF5666
MSPSRAPSTVLLGALAALAVALTFGAEPAGAQTTNPGTTRPFASGMLSSISGSTLQVQEGTGNATVVVTPSTSYQQTKTAATSDIAAGACVRVTGTGSMGAGIQATTVALSKPPKGGCSLTARTGGRFGGRFRNGTRPNLPNGQRPNFPNGQQNVPSGSPGNDANGGSRPANFAVAFGSVKSVSGDEMTVKAYTISRPASNSNSNSNSNAKPKVKTQTVTVTLTSNTTVTQTTSATEKDLAVGSCVNANGNVDSVGTITAQRVGISQPQNGACIGFGFGGGFGGRGRFGGGGQFGGGDQQTA